jgi:H+/Cl- antiporter ClcA
MSENIGKWLLIAGIILILGGLILIYFKNAFSWFGNLPGDFKYKGENTSFFFPLTSMLIISLILNVILWIIRQIISK